MGGGLESFEVDGGVERGMRARDVVAFDEIVGVDLPVRRKADSGLIGGGIGLQRLVRQFGGQRAKLIQETFLRVERREEQPAPFGQLHRLQRPVLGDDRGILAIPRGLHQPSGVGEGPFVIGANDQPAFARAIGQKFRPPVAADVLESAQGAVPAPDGEDRRAGDVDGKVLT